MKSDFNKEFLYFRILVIFLNNIILTLPALIVNQIHERCDSLNNHLRVIPTNISIYNLESPFLDLGK